MAKRRKSRPPADVAQLQSDREWLIRTTLIGLGYVTVALEAAKEAGDAVAIKTAQRHVEEIERAIQSIRPAAEDVLRILGKRVSMLADVLRAYPGRAGITEQQHNEWIFKKERVLKEIGLTRSLAEAPKDPAFGI